MNNWLQRDELNLPDPETLPFDDSEVKFPYYFVADEAFPLLKHLMRPYPKRRLNNRARIFNYRLSRALKNVECAFGMMSQKFPVLLTAIRCKNVMSVNKIIRAVSILQNFIRKRKGKSYFTHYNDEKEYSKELPFINVPTVNNVTVDERSNSQQLRDCLSYYFLGPQAAVHWQWKYCINEYIFCIV
jgi:hypothetical protein